MTGFGREAEHLRVLVADGGPMEACLERLLSGLAADGMKISIRSPHRPSTEWLANSGICWEHGGRGLGREKLQGQLRHNSPLDTARAVAVGVRHRLVATRKRSPLLDVVYAPRINMLMSDQHLFDLAVPVVASCQASSVTHIPWDPTHEWYDGELQQAFERATLVHCESRHIFDEVADLGLDRAKARVIHPAVDPTRFRPADRSRQGGPIRVLGVGALKWSKDYEHALIALRGALDRGADVVLELIGDGADLQHLRYTVDDLDLRDHVEFSGHRPAEQVAVALQRADVFLHSGIAEGLSNAVLEAMASGLPVITTDAGGMSEAVQGGQQGFVVPVRGTTEMASALVRLADDVHLRRRMGDSGRQRILDVFGLDQQISAFRRLLEEAVSIGVSG